jgi:pilus assembly protein CpaB
MRSNNLIILLVAVALGGVAAFLARNWLASHAHFAGQAGTGTIVVAATPLTFGAQLTGENLDEIPWSTRALPEGAFATKQEVLKEGRRMALASITHNEPILRSKITAPGQRATLSSILEPGKRAVTVRVDDVRGVAGFIQPGDRVDVVLIRTEMDSRKNESSSDIILQFAKVLAIDQITGERTEQPTIAKAVTLEVSPEEAQKILLATNIGRLSLVLRQPDEAGGGAAKRVTETDLGYTPVQPKAISPPPAVQVVRASPPPAPTPHTRRITIWHGMRSQVYEPPIYERSAHDDDSTLSSRAGVR